MKKNQLSSTLYLADNSLHDKVLFVTYFSAKVPTESASNISLVLYNITMLQQSYPIMRQLALFKANQKCPNDLYKCF